MRRRDRLYRALLRCYPAEFRADYASEMTQLARDRLKSEPRARVWFDLVTDVAMTAPKEHSDMLFNDLRYALRLLRKAPLFTSAVILTMALGIGANTAIFSVVNAVILRPLPFTEPAGLVQVAEKNDKLHLDSFGASVLNYLSWKEQTKAFDQLGAIGFASFNLSGRGDPEQFVGSTISPSVLPILGLRPIVGRRFQEGEDRPGSEPVVLISEALWKRRFGADPALVGSHLTLNGVDHTVVGVLPPAIGILTPGDMWVPLTIDPGRERRLNHVIIVIGRLRSGITVRQAQAEMDTIARGVGQQYPEVKDWGINLITFDKWLVSDQLRAALLVLLAAIGCVLVIACANVANLLLARAASRQKEIAVRTVMGASRSRLLRQLLVESLTLAVLGGVAGLLAATWAVRVINTNLSPNLLPIPDVSIDATVLLFAGGVTLITGMLFGIMPAWHAARTDLNAVLKQSGRSASGGARPIVRNSLAAAEIALATVLLIGAGLLVQSLARLQRVQLGFQSDGVLTFQVSLPAAKYPAERAIAFYRQFLDAVATLPGVRSAAVSSGIPFGQGNYTTSPLSTPSASVLPKDAALPIDWRLVSPGFFQTLRIPVLRGRTFTDADGPTAPAVAIVSEATAKKFWGSDDPIGKVLHRVADGKEYSVIGLVADVRNTALNQDSPTMYLSSAIRVWPLMDVAVRSDAQPELALPGIRRKLRELDPELAIAMVRPMNDWVRASAAQPRLNAVLLGIFAAVAVLVAAIGIYGVMAYSVTQRTREIGLRMALGAQRTEVVRLIVREGMILGLAGVGVGLVCAVGLSRVLTTLVFGVQVRDPATFAGVAVVLTVVALAACAVPARKASALDPMIALRGE